MCRAAADGGRRCVCPPPTRRATRRAKYAADRLTVAGDVEATARTDGGRRYTADDLVDRSPAHLDALAVAWADRDPDYAADINGARTLVALDCNGDEDLTGLNDLWRGGTTHPRVTRRRNPGTPQVTRTVTDADGDPYVYGDHGWEQVAHQPEQVGDEIRAAGLLHRPESGEWLTYTAVETTPGQWTTDGVVSDDLTAAGEALPAWARDRLGLPERPLVEEVRLPSKADLTKTMKDLRKSLVADDADEDAALNFAAEISRQRLEAVGRGAATDHNWSLTNRALAYQQARARGAHPVGFYGGLRQWDARDREVIPGAQGTLIWAPVASSGRTAAATDDDSETGPQPGEQSLRELGRSSRVGFAQVRVYDWTETRRKDGAQDPDWAPTIPGGSEALYARMVASSPLPVVEDSTGSRTGKAHGWTDGRKIVIDSRKPVGDRLHTLAHEMAHNDLDHPGRVTRGEVTREQAEQEAETTAYLVVRSLRLGDDTDKAATKGTAAYLRSWTQADGSTPAGHKARWKALSERVGVATDSAHRILTRLLDLDRPEAAA